MCPIIDHWQRFVLFIETKSLFNARPKHTFKVCCLQGTKRKVSETSQRPSAACSHTLTEGNYAQQGAVRESKRLECTT